MDPFFFKLCLQHNNYNYWPNKTMFWYTKVYLCHEQNLDINDSKRLWAVFTFTFVGVDPYQWWQSPIWYCQVKLGDGVVVAVGSAQPRTWPRTLNMSLFLGNHHYPIGQFHKENYSINCHQWLRSTPMRVTVTVALRLILIKICLVIKIKVILLVWKRRYCTRHCGFWISHTS